MKTNQNGEQPDILTRLFIIDRFVQKREPEEVVVIHHYISTKKKCWIEVERRSKTLGVKFGKAN